jgi:HSP20 family molecular chaperone IbpA
MFITAAPALYHRPVARAFDGNFERFLSNSFAQPQCRGASVTQDEKAWTLSLDLPGVAREQLSITINENRVALETVEGAERKVKLAYALAQDIDAAASTAKLENGVLTLTLAKKVPVDTSVKLTVA